MKSIIIILRQLLQLYKLAASFHPAKDWDAHDFPKKVY